MTARMSKIDDAPSPGGRKILIVLEGPDGSGKSTLALVLATALKLEIRHEGPPGPGKASLLNHYVRALAEGAESLGRGVIFDRLAHSEVVYGLALRGQSRVSPLELQAFSAGLRARGALLVCCLPPPDECSHNWAAGVGAGRELFANPAKFWETYARFAAMALANEFDAIYDYTRESPFDLMMRLWLS
jgi:hypothetical protein